MKKSFEKLVSTVNVKKKINLFLTCPICGEKRTFKQKINLELQRTGYIFCDICTGGVLYPRPNIKKTNSLYKTSSYFNLLSKPVNNFFLQWILTRKIYKTPVEWVLKKFIKKGKVLDVGCGNGEFLFGLNKNGWKVWGSDISMEAITRTRKLLNVNFNNINKGSFDKQIFKTRFDLISFWHVLEHLNAPTLYIKKAYKTLKKRGNMVAEVPNFDSYTFNLFGPSYAWIMVPDHLIYFNIKSLKIILRKNGFKKINFYFPTRGLLNFSISLKNFLINKKFSFPFVFIIFVLSIPFSIIFIILFSLGGHGEVIRLTAQK